MCKLSPDLSSLAFSVSCILFKCLNSLFVPSRLSKGLELNICLFLKVSKHLTPFFEFLCPYVFEIVLSSNSIPNVPSLLPYFATYTLSQYSNQEDTGAARFSKKAADSFGREK